MMPLTSDVQCRIIFMILILAMTMAMAVARAVVMSMIMGIGVVEKCGNERDANQ